MGLNEHFLGLMIGLKEKGQLNGLRVMEIGAQQLSDSLLRDRASQEKLARLYGKSPADLPDFDWREGGPTELWPHARSFYEALGYEYACIDIDGTPGALALDLNYDEVPSAHRGRYDLVTNFGTTEHVLNQLNAFRLIHDLTAPGGVMIHEVPAQGLIDHGFLAYNPKMFRLMGESNGYATLFFDFRWTEVRGVLPIHIVAEIENYISTIGRPLCGISEAVLFVVQQKVRDRPFVPPLDVRRYAGTPSAVIADRYWPGFRKRPRIRLHQYYRLVRRAAALYVMRR